MASLVSSSSSSSSPDTPVPAPDDPTFSPNPEYIRPSHSYIDPTDRDFASTHTMLNDPTTKGYQEVASLPLSHSRIFKPTLHAEITKGVLRKKLSKMRHLCVEKAVSPEYLDELMPEILRQFQPQRVNYNGGVANIKEWKVRGREEIVEVFGSRERGRESARERGRWQYLLSLCQGRIPPLLLLQLRPPSPLFLASLLVVQLQNSSIKPA